MASELAERDIKTFYFKQCLKVRVHPSPSSIVKERVNLLCVSNKYGFIFVGHPTGVKVYKTENLIQKGATIENANDIVEDLPIWTEITGVCPSHIAISCDDITLAVCTQKSGLVFGVMYDVRALQDKNQLTAPFLEVALTSSPAVTVQDLAWNPGLDWAAIMAVCTSDGGLVLLQIQDTLTILARLPAAAATCLCWSPKGKQLVAGKANGTLTQYDQALKEKKTIACPPALASSPKKVIDVLWQSTHVFVTSYESPNATDESDRPQVVISTYPKTGAPSFLLCEDLCFGSGEERKSQYFLNQLADWEFFLGVSSNSVETVVVGKKADDKTSWERWTLDDAGRADMPMNENYDEMYPTGLAVDVTSQTQIQISDTEVQPASPILMLLSTDGLLIAFHMINTIPGALQLVRPPQVANPAEQRRPLAVKQSSQAAPQSPELKNLLTSGSGTPSAARSLFQPVASSAASPAPAQSSLFGGTTGSKPEATSSKSSLFGGLGSTGPSFAFAKPAAESKPQVAVSDAGSKQPSTFTFGGKSMFGSLQQASEGTTASPSKPAASTGFSFGVASTGPSSGNTPSKSAFSFGGATSLQHPTQATPNVSGAQPSGATASFSFSAKPPSGTNTPLASSTPAKREVIPSEEVKGKPPPTTKPLVVPSDAVKSKPPIVPSEDVRGKPPQTVRPVAPVAPAAAGGTPAFGMHRPTSPRHPPPGLAHKAPVNKVAVQAQPREPVVRQTSQVKTPDPKAENPFTKAILEEKSQFEKEMKEMKAKVMGLSLEVGSKEELIALKRDTDTMTGFSADMADTMKSIQLDVHGLKSDCLEAFALIEECNARHERNQEPKYQSLLRSRSLDPQNQRRMKEIRSQYQWVQSGIREADLKLDTEWEQYLAKRNGGQPLRTPATDGIYRTVSNTHNVIVNQNRVLEKLKRELKQTRLHNTTSTWTPSSAAPFRDVSTHHDSWSRDIVAGQGDISLEALRSAQHSNVINANLVDKATKSPSKVASSPISPEKNAKLREILSKRKVTPVRSSRPENPSISQFVSGERIRQMLEQAEDDQQSFTPQRPAAASFRGQHPGFSSPDIYGSPVKPQQKEVKSQQSTFLNKLREADRGLNLVNQNIQQKSPAKSPGIRLSQQVHSPEDGRITFGKSSPTKGSNGTQAKFSFVKPSAEQGSEAPKSGGIPIFNFAGKQPASVSVKPVMPTATTQQPAPEATGHTTPSKMVSPGFTFGQTKPENAPAPSTNLFGTVPKSGAASGFSFQASQAGASFNFAKKPTGTLDLAEAQVTESSKGGLGSFSFTAKSPTRDVAESDRDDDAPKEKLQAENKPGGLFTFTPSNGGASGFSFGAANQTEPKKDESSAKAGFGSGFTFGKLAELGSKDEVGKSDDKPKSGSLSGFAFKTPESPVPTASAIREPPKPAKEVMPVKTSVEVSDAAEGQTTPAAEATAKENTGPTRKSPAAKSLFRTTDEAVSPVSPPASAATKPVSPAAAFAFKLPSSKEEEEAGKAGTPTSTEVSGSALFGQTSGLFTKPSASPSSGLFGTTAPTGSSVSETAKSETASNTTVTTPGGLFGQVATSGGSIFGGTGGSASIFGGSGGAASTAGSIFGNTSSTTTTPSSTSTTTSSTAATTATGLFGGGLFGTASKTTPAGSGIFGNTSTTATTSASGDTFGGTATSGGLFGGSSSTTTTASGGLFGAAATATTAGGSIFGGTSTTSSAAGGLFGGAGTTTTASSLFGGTSTAVTAATTTTASGLFGQGSSAPLFGSTATSGGSIFGTAAAASSSSSIFGNTASSSTGIFGNATSTSSASTGFSFGQAATTTASTGLGFGQSSATTAGSGFGQPGFGQTPGFGQQTSSGSGFGQAAPQDASASSGGGGMFGGFGLGGKPSAENANKNVFGSTSFGATTQNTSLFGGTSSSGFGTATSGAGSFGCGPFSGGSSGSVAASGFGSVQQGQVQSPSKPGVGFGSAPAFGSPPAFGGGATFGSPPAFGGNAFGGTPSFANPGGAAASPAIQATQGVFGSASGGGGFASFAEASAPSFGGLAQSTNTPAFGGSAFGSTGSPATSSFQSYR